MANVNPVRPFPQKFSGSEVQKTPSHAVRQGDPDVSRLWQQYTHGQVSSGTWAFRRQVIQATKRLLGQSDRWWVSQDTNPELDKYHYEFVVDTLRFIAGHERQVSIYAWPDLLAYYPDQQTSSPQRHDIRDLIGRLKLATGVNDIIRAWCSRQGGFDDMLCTLNLLFGDLSLRVDHPQTD